MRFDNVVSDMAKSIRHVLLGLDNRLTASDNLGPEGNAGEVLTSNGSSSPPSFQPLAARVEDVLRSHGLIP